MLVLIYTLAIGLLGFLMGFLIPSPCDGLFLIDDGDEEKTQWILDVKIDPEKIPLKKEIRLRVRKMESSCE